jgi:hypothetical protein
MKTNIQHTPPPWELSKNGSRSYVKDPRDNSVIAALFIETPEGEANANLIAAAPDLLEALRMAETQLRWLENQHADAWHDAEREDVKSAQGCIRAAIARATGGAK